MNVTLNAKDITKIINNHFTGIIKIDIKDDYNIIMDVDLSSFSEKKTDNISNIETVPVKKVVKQPVTNEQPKEIMRDSSGNIIAEQSGLVFNDDVPIEEEMKQGVMSSKTRLMRRF